MPKSNGRSSSTDAQLARMVDALRIRKRTTEDFRKMGIFQVSARIRNLRDRGFRIVTHRITLIDRDGYEHHGVALYELIEGGQR